MYDFDETGVLTLDEMVLAFRSTLSGACKLCNIDAPLETEIENTVGIGFDAAKKAADASAALASKSMKAGNSTNNATAAAFDGIEREMFVSFCLTTPDIIAWIEYFDDLLEYAENKSIITCSFTTPTENFDGMPLPTEIDETYMHPSLGGPLRSQQEISLAQKPHGQKPWRSAVNILNVNTAPNKMLANKPSKNLMLNWVYGYNTFYSSNNLFYTHVGHVVFPAGSLVVLQYVSDHSQRYFAHHIDQVTAVASCFVVDQEGNKVNTIIASGERGLRPSIHVWEANSLQLIATLQGFHRGGIQRLEFSPDKEKLATLGMDPYHSIAIYLWKTSQRVWSMRTTTKAVYDVRYLTNDILVSCGEGNIFFWKEVGGKNINVKPLPGVPVEALNALMAKDYLPTVQRKENIILPHRRYRGQASGISIASESFYFVGYIEKSQGVFTGNGTGFLQIWEGRNYMKSIKGHTGAITAFATVNDNGFITGCNLGKVLFWNENLEIIGNFNITSLGPILADVVALSYEPLLAKVLIGMRSSEIYEMDAADGRNVHSGGPITAGHYRPTVYGVAIHPFQASIVATVSNDKTLRLTNITEHRYIKFCSLGTTGRCVAFSPDGMTLLVGIGTGILGQEELKEGGYIMINAEDLTILHEARDSKEVIYDCKFSLDNERYFLSSKDMNIYMYQKRKYQIYGICRGHTAPVMHIDISSNNAYLMSNASNGELLFWDTNTGQVVAPKSMKQVTWEENNCVYSFATQSFWKDDTSAQAYLHDFLNYTRAVRSRANDLIIICDNMGMISVSAYPCYVDKASNTYPTLSQYYAHSQSIANCTITCDDKYLLTVGESDGCLMQWALVSIEAHPVDNPVLDSLKHIDTIPSSLEAEYAFEGKLLDQSIYSENMITLNMAPVADVEEGVVDPKAMMPWQKHIVAPSRIPVEDNTEVSDRLELDYVYGFTCDVTRKNLMYTTISNEIAFFTGNIVVIMTTSTRQQRYYLAHRSKVLAMAINTGLASSQNTTNTLSSKMSSSLKEGSVAGSSVVQEEMGSIMATGDLGRLPKIYVWDSRSMKTICCLSGYHRRGINHLLFSNNGKYLLSIGYDAFHSMGIYDWKYQTLLIALPTFTMKSYAVAFSPNDNQIVHCGHEYIGFYSFSGRNIHFKDMKLTYRSKLQAYISIGYIGGNIVVGTMDGSLYRFIDNQLESIIQAHNGPVNGIATSPSDGIVTISSDGFIKIWTKFLECRMIIDMKNLHAITPGLRTIDWLCVSGKLLIGTAGCEVFEISSADGENVHKTSLLEGHGQGEELWGLAINPVKDEFVTVGDDCLLKVWDSINHLSIQTVVLEMPARCCAFSPDGKHIAVGLGGPKKIQERQFDGKWIVVDTIDYQVSHEARDSSLWLHDIGYSPNGQYIVIGGEDCKMYVYNVMEGYSLSAVITQHQSYITNFDFSEDSMWLRGNCGGLELNYFEAETGLYIPAASRLKDVTWATHHCTMEFTSQGIWSIYADGKDYLTCDCNTFRSEEDSGQILITGDNYGYLTLFRYPCLRSKAVGKKYLVSSAPCTRVRFASGDDLLLSLTGKDKSIVQWKHIRDKSDTVAYQTNDRRGVLQEDTEDLSDWMLMFTNNVNDAELLQSELKKLVTIRPWIGAVVEPSNIQEYLNNLQDMVYRFSYRLAMTHVYNIQVQLARKQAFYNASYQIIYPQSHYLITYNKQTNIQQYYLGHQGSEISCMAVSENKQYVVSATKGTRPEIHIWDALTTHAINVLPFVHRRGVLSLAFSPDNHYLLSVGVDDDHSIALWYSALGNWSDAALHSWQRGDIAPVLFANFYPIQTKDMEFLFVSGGRFHIKFWINNGTSINPVYAEYGKQIKIGTFLCGNMVGRKYVSGSTMGHLFVWKGRTLDRMIRAHERGITNIVVSPNKSTLNHTDGTVITAAKEGTIKLWTFNFEHIHTFSLSDADIPPIISTIRSLDVIGDITGIVHTILASAVSGEMYEVFVSTARIGIVLEGHYDGEVHGLCVHPTNSDLFLTTGDDCTIRLWSVSEKRLLKKAVIDCTTRCASWSPNGEMIVMGLGGKSDGTRQRKDGAFVVLDGQSLRPKYEGR